MRTSTEATTVPTTLDLATILLKLYTSPAFQTLKLLPISPCGTETQEPDAQGNATSFYIEQVAVTQEPATQSVAVP